MTCPFNRRRLREGGGQPKKPEARLHTAYATHMHFLRKKKEKEKHAKINQNLDGPTRMQHRAGPRHQVRVFAVLENVKGASYSDHLPVFRTVQKLSDSIFFNGVHRDKLFYHRPLTPRSRTPHARARTSPVPTMFKNTFQSGFLSILYSIGYVSPRARVQSPCLWYSSGGHLRNA